MRRSNSKFTLGLLFSLMVGSAARAGNIEAAPVGWRLQDYVGGSVVAYYTGSPCTSGALILNGSADEIKRFWDLVMNAKTTGKAVGVYYDDGTCVIQSFYAR